MQYHRHLHVVRLLRIRIKSLPSSSKKNGVFFFLIPSVADVTSRNKIEEVNRHKWVYALWQIMVESTSIFTMLG